MFTEKNYIPIAGPSVRIPYDGTEPYLRPNIGFTPTYLHHMTGADFSEQWHTDPVFRSGEIKKCMDFLYKTFPEYESYCVPESPACKEISYSFNIIHGITFMLQLYGFPAVYHADQWPDIAASRQLLSRSQVENLQPIDLDNNLFFQKFLRQLDQIEEISGRLMGTLQTQGILNLAFRLRGEEIFIDMIEEPELAHHLFEHIADALTKVVRYIHQRQKKTGDYNGCFSVSNCTVNLISPDSYEEFILPYDMKLSHLFERFGMHTCNWDGTAYFDSFAKIDRLGHLDTGFCSDLAAMRKTCPNTHRGVILHPMQFAKAAPEELWNALSRVAADCGPCDVILADLDGQVPIETIKLFLRYCGEISEKYEQDQTAFAQFESIR